MKNMNNPELQGRLLSCPWDKLKVGCGTSAVLVTEIR